VYYYMNKNTRVNGKMFVFYISIRVEIKNWRFRVKSRQKNIYTCENVYSTLYGFKFNVVFLHRKADFEISQKMSSLRRSTYA